MCDRVFVIAIQLKLVKRAYLRDIVCQQNNSYKL